MSEDDRRTLSFTTDADTASRIESYNAREGIDNRSKAIDELVQFALREKRGPILYRWRESASTVALIFACGAIAVAIVGMGTPIMSPAAAVAVSGAFAAVGLGLMAIVELARTFRGSNELATVLRRAKQ